jgi:hypothetical protein
VSDTQPTRRLHVKLDLHADGLDEVRQALEQIGLDLLMDPDETVERTSGGWASGYHLSIKCDPDMDGDRYRRELSAWSAAQHEAS